MLRVLKFLVPVILIQGFLSCSPDDQASNPETLIQGVWKPITKQYLNNSGEVERTLTNKESSCLAESRWSFSLELFHMYDLTENEYGICESDMHRSNGTWGEKEGKYYLFYSGGFMIAESFEILKISNRRMMIKYMDYSLFDPIIITFEKTEEEPTVIVNF